MGDQAYDRLRQAMVASQLRTTAVNDPRVVAAMGAVSREDFVPADRAALAYLDIAVPLTDARALPAPMVLGRLLTEARVRPADRVLIVGAGSGYAAAVASRLAGSIVALEEDDALASIARVALPANVTSVRGPLADGWADGAPYDAILFDGTIERTPDAIVAQLAEGGRLAAPMLERGVVRLAIGRKAGGAFGTACFADAAAPALPGFAPSPAFQF